MYVFRRSKQLACLSFALLVLIIIYLHARSARRSQDLASLPGTYQYFLERDFHSTTHTLGGISHCDTRFAPEYALEEDEVRRTLKALLASYAATMHDLGVKTWMAHGTLLGWYWNHQLLPWDTDLDVQMSFEDIRKLAKIHNMTKYRHPFADTDSSREYLLDINPHYLIPLARDTANKIDGRWIDVTNGKYIDITAVHGGDTSTGNNEMLSLFCKDGHHYEVIHITLNDGSVY